MNFWALKRENVLLPLSLWTMRCRKIKKTWINVMRLITCGKLLVLFSMERSCSSAWTLLEWEDMKFRYTELLDVAWKWSQNFSNKRYRSSAEFYRDCNTLDTSKYRKNIKQDKTNKNTTQVQNLVKCNNFSCFHVIYRKEWWMVVSTSWHLKLQRNHHHYQHIH